MGSIYIYPAMKIEHTPEELEEIEALKNMPDEDIDLSDIPELTEEDFKRMWRANPRTPEEWEQYFRYNPKADPKLKRKFEASRTVG